MGGGYATGPAATSGEKEALGEVAERMAALKNTAEAVQQRLAERAAAQPVASPQPHPDDVRVYPAPASTPEPAPPQSQPQSQPRSVAPPASPVIASAPVPVPAPTPAPGPVAAPTTPPAGPAPSVQAAETVVVTGRPTVFEQPQVEQPQGAATPEDRPTRPEALPVAPAAPLTDEVPVAKGAAADFEAGFLGDMDDDDDDDDDDELVA